MPYIYIVKHYCLYQYVQRVLRPIWQIKLGYYQDKQFKISFDSLKIPKKKLCELIGYIEQNEFDLCGETFSGGDIKTKESFF